MNEPSVRRGRIGRPELSHNRVGPVRSFIMKEARWASGSYLSVGYGRLSDYHSGLSNALT